MYRTIQLIIFFLNCILDVHNQLTSEICLYENERGCTSRARCCSGLICSRGPDSNWKLGLCTKTNLNSIPSPEQGNREEDQYNNLTGRMVIEGNNNSPVRCRDLDPRGEYFYRINRTHSFRICDSCAELPFQKLTHKKIVQSEFVASKSESFAKCFNRCVTQTKCVAFSFNQNQKLCLISDQLEKEYVEDKNWTSVIITQPIDVLRDYVYSRHTKVTCHDSEKISFNDTTILECLERCSQARCYVAVYHDGICMIHQKFENCSNVYYHYGYVTMFYQEQLSDNPGWRFLDVDTSQIFDNASLHTLNFEADEIKTISALLDDCFSSCLQKQFCSGVLVNFGDKKCEAIDWSKLKTNDYRKGGQIEYKLIQQERESRLYNYIIQTKFGSEVITYNEKYATNLEGCVDKCNADCRKIYFNLVSNQCLILTDYIGSQVETILENSSKYWVEFRRNRPSFNSNQVHFALIGEHIEVAQNFNSLLLQSVVLRKNESRQTSASEACFTQCNTLGDLCMIVQIRRQENYLECRLYRRSDDQNISNFTKTKYSAVYVRRLTSNFDLTYMNQMELFDVNDAKNCKLDLEGIETNLVYLYDNQDQTANPFGLNRRKRGWLSALGSAAKAVVKEVKNYPVKKIIKTVEHGARATGRLIRGDTTGAFREFRSAPLVKDGERLVGSAKMIGQGIMEGNPQKISRGVSDVMDNDLLKVIPYGNVGSIGAKLLKPNILGAVQKGFKIAGKIKELYDLTDEEAEVVHNQEEDVMIQEVGKTIFGCKAGTLTLEQIMAIVPNKPPPGYCVLNPC